MKGLGFILLAVALVLLSSASSAANYSSKSMSVKLYADGYALVSQTLTVDPRATSVQIPLVSPVVSNLVATDQNGSPLSYGFSTGGENITVYTVGATEATISYDTDNITMKQGTVWTVIFTTRFNLTLVLPQSSTIASVSGIPYSINQTGAFPEMQLSPGTWSVSYGIPLSGSTASTGSAGGPGGGYAGFSDQEIEVAGAVVVGAAAVVLVLRWWRRRGIGPAGGDLRPDDLQVLGFIRERGGRVLEPEIRMKFALPKTSAWRQIKRLERLGYVKVTKIGSQNQVELVKERSPGA